MRVLASAISAITICSSAVAFVPSTPSSIVQQHRSSQLSPLYSEIAGTVKWYNAERGFGFIELDEGGPDMYVHATGLSFQGPLIEEERVSFGTETDSRTNKPKAINVVRTNGEAPAAAAEEEPVVESVVEKVVEVVKEESNEGAVKALAFQRARLGLQVEVMKKDAVAAAEKAAVEANDAEEAAAALAKAAEEAAAANAAEEAAAAKAAAEAKAAEEAAAAKAAAEAKAAEDAAAAKATAEAKAAEEAEKAAAEAKAAEEAAAAKAAAEAKAAEEAAAAKAAAEAKAAEEAAAAKAAEEAAAQELGYPSADTMKARQQPKSAEEEAALAAKYSGMDLGEKAFTILVDLGMIDLNPDPSDPNRDTSKDEDDL